VSDAVPGPSSQLGCGKTNSAIRGHSGAKGRIVTGVETGTADSDTCLRELGWPIAVSGSP